MIAKLQIKRNIFKKFRLKNKHLKIFKLNKKDCTGLVKFLARYHQFIFAMLSLGIILPVFFTVWIDKPLLIMLLTYIPLGLYTVYVWIPFIRVFWYISRVKLHNASIDISKYMVTRNGTPGAGKTSSLVYDGVILARKMWLELRYQYAKDLAKEAKLYASGDKEKIQRWERIKEAYLFYSVGDCVPCLWSNIPMKVGKLFTNICTRRHLEQVDRIAEYTVLIVDEVGSVVSIDETGRKERPIEIGELARWCRHFGEFHIYCTEQDKNNVNKDIRRCVCENKYMFLQKPVLKPLILSWLFNFFKDKFSKKPTKRKSQLFSGFMENFEKFIKFSGYRKYYYKDFAGTESGFSSMVAYGEDKVPDLKQLKRGVSTFILPAILNAVYDDRCYRNFYKAKDKPLQKNVWKSLVISSNQEEFFRKQA